MLMKSKYYLKIVVNSRKTLASVFRWPLEATTSGTNALDFSVGLSAIDPRRSLIYDFFSTVSCNFLKINDLPTGYFSHFRGVSFPNAVSRCNGKALSFHDNVCKGFYFSILKINRWFVFDSTSTLIKTWLAIVGHCLRTRDLSVKGGLANLYINTSKLLLTTVHGVSSASVKVIKI